VNYFWLDANAIVKQYVTETGTLLINYLFARVSLNRIFCLFDCMGEVRFAIAKKKNERRTTIAAIDQAIQRFEEEFLHRDEVQQVHATESQKRTAWQRIDPHTGARIINNTDAYILQCALDTVDELRTAGDDLILVSSDKDLLVAAKKEGLLTFDPEIDNQINLDVLINS
jgi:predicted nucleic acid-binding protein